MSVGEGHTVNLLSNAIYNIARFQKNFKSVYTFFEYSFYVDRVLPKSVGCIKNWLVIQFDLGVGIDALEDKPLKWIFVAFLGNCEVETIAIITVRDPFDQRVVFLKKRIRNISSCQQIEVYSGGDAGFVCFGFEGLCVWRASNYFHLPFFRKVKLLVLLCGSDCQQQ